MATRWIVAVALAGLAALVAGLLLPLPAGDEPCSPAETRTAAVSRRGDVAESRRRVPVAVDETAPRTPQAGEPVADAAPSDESDAPDPSPPPVPPQRVLRIVDGAGDPVPGVYVRIKYPAESQCWTDVHGEASVDASDPAPDVEFSDGVAWRELELRDPTTSVVVETMRRLEVAAIDARTGSPVDPVRFTLRRIEGEERVLWTGGAPATWANSSFGVSVEPPGGYGAYREHDWSGDVASRTRTARYLVPLFPATTRTLKALLPDGRRASGVTVVAADVAERPDSSWWRAPAVTWTAAPSGDDGLVRISGLPCIPFTRLRVELKWKGTFERRARTLGALVGDIDLCAPAPEEPTAALLGPPPEFRDPSSAPPPPPGWSNDGPTADLDVRVRYRDGTPAWGVVVRAPGQVRYCGPDGRVSFEGLPVGPTVLLAAIHGFTPTAAAVDVGTAKTLEIREAPVRAVRVVVRDHADDRPVVCACVTARCAKVAGFEDEGRWAGCGLAQLVDGVETLNPLTERSGAVVLDVARGIVEYTATLGDATWTVSTDKDEVVIWLRDPHR